MKLRSRPGMVSRVFDGKYVTVALNTDYSGIFQPHIDLHRHGKNGSVAGFGTKHWPAWVLRLDRPFRREHTWSGILVIPCPHISWARAYRWRKFGGLRAYRIIHAFYWKAFRRAS